MTEVSPDELSGQLQGDEDDVLVLDIRHRDDYEEWHIPDHPPKFERVKRTNVGQEDVSDEELSELELGPNRCAAE